MCTYVSKWLCRWSGNHTLDLSPLCKRDSDLWRSWSYTFGKESWLNSVDSNPSFCSRKAQTRTATVSCKYTYAHLVQIRTSIELYKHRHIVSLMHLVTTSIDTHLYHGFGAGSLGRKGLAGLLSGDRGSDGRQGREASGGVWWNAMMSHGASVILAATVHKSRDSQGWADASPCLASGERILFFF